MTPEQAAVATRAAIVDLPSVFMLDMATYAAGAELGFSGIDFYVCGRGGALGEVDGDVVAAAFVFFEPGGVLASWEAGRRVLAPRDAAREFIRIGHTWADDHLGHDVDLARLAELLGTVVAGADPAGAPLCAAWRSMPEPGVDRPGALVLHRLNVLRELRGGLHGAAVLAAGLSPLEAVVVKTPHMAGIFGWPEPLPDVVDRADAWSEAERATTRALARAAFGHLEPAARAELAELCAAVASPGS